MENITGGVYFECTFNCGNGFVTLNFPTMDMFYEILALSCPGGWIHECEEKDD